MKEELNYSHIKTIQLEEEEHKLENELLSEKTHRAQDINKLLEENNELKEAKLQLQEEHAITIQIEKRKSMMAYEEEIATLKNVISERLLKFGSDRENDDSDEDFETSGEDSGGSGGSHGNTQGFLSPYVGKGGKKSKKSMFKNKDGDFKIAINAGLL